MAADNFERVANTPRAWELLSEDLWTAAQILKERRLAVDNSVTLKDGDPVPPESMVRPVEMMLRGFALENLMKAWWVKQQNLIVRGGKYIGVRNPDKVPDHELALLAEAVGLTVNPKSKDVLERLSLFTTFVGRYPIPKNARHGSGVGWWIPRTIRLWTKYGRTCKPNSRE